VYGSDVLFMNEGIGGNDTASKPMALGSWLWASIFPLRSGRVCTGVGYFGDASWVLATSTQLANRSTVFQVLATMTFRSTVIANW
jgi:hypothetical protein